MKCFISATAVAIASFIATVSAGQTIDSLRVMTYNIWLGGINPSGQPLSQTVNVIQAAQADVIGLQEQNGRGPEIAAMLGFNYRNLGGSTGIASRYPIVEGYSFGAKLQISPTQQAYVFDVHLTPFPYQPYDIRDGLITTEAQAIAQAEATRGASVDALLSDVSSALGSGLPVFLTGDFNEPSHLDWTQDAANAGLNFNRKVDWPASQKVADAGLVDAFRELRPDEIGDRAETWTPGYPAPTVDADEVHDRIDFVYYTGIHVEPIDALVLGHSASDPNTDIVVAPYPSDHRSVVVDFDIPICSMLADLSGNCAIDAADWSLFRSGQHVDMTGLSHNEAYLLGDLNGDFQNDHTDFVIFKMAYDGANGAGSFANLFVQTPEPSSFVLGTLATFICLSHAKARRRKV